MDSVKPEGDRPSMEISKLEWNDSIHRYLWETAVWAKFLAIVGFVIIGLFVLGSFWVGNLINSISNDYEFPKSISTIFYLIFAILYFIPSLLLFNFSIKTRKALKEDDQISINEGFSNLRSFFKYVGILTIIFLSINLIIVFGIVIGVYLSPK